MQDIYITAFQHTSGEGRKEILNAVWEGMQGGDTKERNKMKKIYEEIKEILFQEGKRPM